MKATLEKNKTEKINSNEVMTRKDFLEKTALGMAAVAIVGKFGVTALGASAITPKVVENTKTEGSQIVGPVAPSDISKTWIDTSVGGVQKFWNGFEWTPVKSTWG